MKPRPIYRLIFVVLVTIGTVLFLQGARKESKQNLRKNTYCTEVQLKDQATSNNDFIFFESVTKFLVISLIR